MNHIDNIVINPLTNRPIALGGRVYKRLIKHGYTRDDFINKNPHKYKLQDKESTIHYDTDEGSVIDEGSVTDEGSVIDYDNDNDNSGEESDDREFEV